MAWLAARIFSNRLSRNLILFAWSALVQLGGGVMPQEGTDAQPKVPRT